ncbi:MAG TPA: hypothetical protein VFU45_04335 [Gemmatimonadales bacterium]|nr:hypothetical protein [Gemmatimonadales bacterium]
MKAVRFVAALLFLAGPVAAQADTSLARAFDLERRGAFAGAADAYRGLLQREPGNLAALLGLQRSLTPLGREGELGPLLAPVLRAAPTPAVFDIALRAWLAVGERDSARSVVVQWARVDPDRLAPYREWGDLLLSRRDAAGARQAYEAGRAASGDSASFAVELAQAETLDGDLVSAAAEWARAIGQFPAMRPAAVASLARAPAAQRGRILHALDGAGPAGRSVATLLTAGWGDAAGAVDRVAADIASGSGDIGILQALVGELRGSTARPARGALGRALELLAARQSGPAIPSLRLEAARAYADGGDRASARRMLSLVLADPGASAALGPGSARIVIEVLIGEGDLAEAERQLDHPAAGLAPDDARALRRRLALALAQAGELDRAQRLLVADSSVETAAIQGRLFLYMGDLANARRALKWAGPFAGDRAEATERVRLLALLQPIEADTLRALGAGLWALDRGDTVGAVTLLTPLADSLPPGKGGAETAFLLGRVSVARGDTVGAARWLRRAVSDSVGATSPAAEYALARFLAARGHRGEAIASLQHLILAWPTSAVVPEARRLLEQLQAPAPGAAT